MGCEGRRAWGCEEWFVKGSMGGERERERGRLLEEWMVVGGGQIHSQNQGRCIGLRI